MTKSKIKLKFIFKINSIGFFIASVVMFLLYNYTKAKNEKLQKEGIRVYASITKKTISKSKNDVKYYLHYKYNNFDVYYDDRNQVQKSYWEKTGIGERITVIFDKKNPQNSVIDSPFTIDSNANIFMILTIIFFITGIFDLVFIFLIKLGVIKIKNSDS